jgi:hypothetical protein
MVEGQGAAPGKCIGSDSLSSAEDDAGRGLSAPIVYCIDELDGPTRAVGRDMNGGRIGDGHRSSTGQSSNRRRIDRHVNLYNLKG